MKVLAVGTTGKYAHHVVPELKRRGIFVRALIRRQDEEESARRQGVDEVAVANLQDPEGLRAAAEGVEGVFHIGPAFAPEESQMGINMVEAAQAAGVRRFVYSSVLHPSLPLPNHRAKIPVQEALFLSGMNFTILEPAMFMQNLESSWSTIVDQRRFALPFNPDAKGCYVDYRDVAETAGIAFATDRLDYGTFELCAAGMLSRVEIAGLMSRALGVRIEADALPFDAWADHAKLAAGPLREGFRQMYAEYDRSGFPGGNALVLRTILGREPRSMADFLSEQPRDVPARAA